MSREKEGFREQLESIIQKFPEGECLRPIQVAEYTGLDKYRITSKFTFIGCGKRAYITRTSLARQITP